MSSTATADEIVEQYNEEDLPPLDINQFRNRRERYGQGENEVEIGIGDLIIRRSTSNTGGVEHRYVLNTMEGTGCVTYVIEDGRYAFYPGEYIATDNSQSFYQVEILQDPWGLRERAEQNTA